MVTQFSCKEISKHQSCLLPDLHFAAKMDIISCLAM